MGSDRDCHYRGSRRGCGHAAGESAGKYIKARRGDYFGDSPELTVGVPIILGTAYLLRKSGGWDVAAVIDFVDNHGVAQNTRSPVKSIKTISEPQES